MRIGIDLGGTKIEIVVLDDSGREILRQRAPTPKGDYAGTLDTIANLIQAAEKTRPLKGLPVGIGTPGITSPATGLIKNSNSLCLIGKPLQKDLEEKLGRRVRLANDANCFALSEATDGAAQGAGVVFGAILGTGVGGGIVVNGRVLEGANGIAGEWGHNPLPWPTPEENMAPSCYCGRNLCNELFLSGPGLEADHKRVTGEVLSAPEIGGATLQRYEDRLARGLASIINVLDPDVVVLGGGLSNIEHLYKQIPKLWGKYIFSDAVRTKLVRAKHGDSSGVRGAAWLF